MFKYFSVIFLGFSLAEINKCRDNFKCIPLGECEEINSLVDSNTLIDYMQTFSCGYFHEPYVCCARNCETPNGNYGRLVTLKNCSQLEGNAFSSDLSKRQFLNDSFVNETHVCCGKNEDNYLLVKPAPVVEQHVADLSCTTPNGDTANCTHIYDCPSYVEAAAEPNEYFRFINDSFCGYWKEPMVCCGDLSYYSELFANNLPSENKCGLWNVTASGIPPWLVVIGEKDSTDLCVGVLINQQYVITTAVCTGKEFKKLFVHFGECIGNERNNTCKIKVVQMKMFPLQNFVHSEDIGVILLKLEKTLTTGSPVCLSPNQLPIYQKLELIGLKKTNNIITLDKRLSGTTAFTDDCNFGTNLKYICMSSDSINDIRSKFPQQNLILQLKKDRWYLEGLFNRRSWDLSVSNYFYSIYVHKFMPWIKSNIS